MLLQQLTQMKALKEGQMKNAIMDTVEDHCRNADIPDGASYAQAVAAIVKSIRNTDSMASECSVSELTDYVKDYFTEEDYKDSLKEDAGPAKEPSSFEGWLIGNKIIDEDDSYDVIDNAYNQDTYASELADNILKAMKRAKVKSITNFKPQALKIISDTASFTVTGEGPAAKKALAAVPKFAKEVLAYLSQNMDLYEDEYQDQGQPPAGDDQQAPEPAPQAEEPPVDAGPENIGKAGDYTVTLDKKSETVTLKKGDQTVTSMPLVIWSQLKRQ